MEEYRALLDTNNYQGGKVDKKPDVEFTLEDIVSNTQRKFFEQI